MVFQSHIGLLKRCIGPGNHRPAVNKQIRWTTQIFTRVLVFLNESFTLNKKEEPEKNVEELEKNSLPTAAFKKATNMLSSEFREGFGLSLWLYNKALIDQPIRLKIFEP